MLDAMKVVLTTPTGNIGRNLVDLLLQGEVRPTVIVRDPARLAEHVRDRVDVVAGDQSDPAVLDQALEGADVLFWLSPPDYASPDPVQNYAQLGRAASDAVRRNGVKRVVHLSSYGAESSPGFGLIDGLALNEAALNQTDAHVRHLRAGFFYENFLMQLPALQSGQYFSSSDPDSPLAMVAVQDIASLASSLLLNANWTGKAAIYVQSGPLITPERAIAALASGTGRSLAYVQVPQEAVVEGFLQTGASPEVARLYGEMLERFKTFGFDDLGEGRIHVGPTTLEAWSFERLRPLLA